MNATLDVHEIFADIQGESMWAGLPCVFVRLAGCNLSCTWCDTVSARDSGKTMTLDEILEQVSSFSLSLIEITGGEPLIQESCPSLAELLIHNDFRVICETNGSRSIDVLPSEVIRILDLKCPASGQSHCMDWVNTERLLPHDEVKFVIRDRRDYEWSKEVIGEHKLQNHCKAIHFSPVFGILEPSLLGGWILEDRLDVRLHLQIHKYLHARTESFTVSNGDEGPAG